MTMNKIKKILSAVLVIFAICFFTSKAMADPVTEGCTPLPQKYREMSACILCPLFEVILKTDQSIATKAFEALASSFRNVVVVALALFIAYHTLLLVSSFTKQDAPKYINTLLVQIFKVLIVVWMLTNPEYIYKYVIDPLMTAGLEFGLALLLDNGTSGNTVISQFHSEVNNTSGSMPSGVIGKNVLASVIAAVKLFSNSAAKMPAIGSVLICVSVNEASGTFLPDFSMMIQGLVVLGFGWAITLSCCFYLLDSAVRFGIFCALLPFLIASWPFKVTAKYTKTGWDIFMNAFFNFVMVGLVISITSELIMQALSGGKGGLDAIEKALSGSDVEALQGLLEIGGVDFLVLLASCMFAFKLVEQINSLATEMAGGGGSKGIGSKIGGAAAQAVGKVGGMAKSAGGAVAGAVYEGTGAKASVDNMKQGAMNKMANFGAKIGLGNKANPGGAGGGSGGGSGGDGGSGGGSGGDSGSGGSDGGSG